MFSPLLLFFLAELAASSHLRRRRIVDLVYDKSVMKTDKTEMLPVFAEHLPIQVHTTAETECPEIVQGVKGRHEDDFLVLISIQEIACPKEICKKNFASILLPADLDSNRTVAYGCGGKRQQIDWKAISLNIRSQQKDNVLEEVPSEYIKEGEDGLGKAVVAGFAVMGLVIVGLFLVIIFAKINHSKEVKKLKKGKGPEEKKKGNEPKKGPKTPAAKSMTATTATTTTSERSTK